MGHFGNLGGNRPGCRANDRFGEMQDTSAWTHTHHVRL